MVCVWGRRAEGAITMGDLSAGFLFSSLMIGMIGFAMLMYGKKASLT